MVKKIGILGSTGSIGKSALKIIQNNPTELKVVALAAKSNSDLLAEQALIFHPEVVAIGDKDKALELQKRLPHIPVLAGEEGIIAVATHASVELLLSSMASFSGVLPTLRAIEAKKDIALANKEALVSSGKLVMDEVKKHGVHLIPVDSEHTALYQCLKGEDPATVRKIVITSSGGPFRNLSLENLETVTVAEALKHPNFRMGPKVTIDSSTLMNKGLEMIEAHFLYGVPLEKIEIVVHPEQAIHGMVEFQDGSIVAQLCEPNMLIPIQYALTYPKRLEGMLPPFDFFKYEKLHFYKADTDRFRCLALAYAALKEGGSMPCFMNAANEILVERFLNNELPWIEIGRKLETLMESHQSISFHQYEELAIIDAQARLLAKRI